jgi:RNA polymerase sigma factor (sigma-70 family)
MNNRRPTGDAGGPGFSAIVCPTDEQLVEKYQRAGCRGAADELIRRKGPWLIMVVQALLQRFYLPAHDLDEALQAGALAIWEAMRAYRPPPTNHGKHCSFETFMKPKVKDRLLDLLRNRRRADRRHRCQDLAAVAAIEPIVRADATPAFGVFRQWCATPDQELGQDELRQELAQLVGQLDTDEVRLVELRSREQTLEAIAEALEVSKEEIWNRFRRLRSRLRRVHPSFGGWAQGRSRQSGRT